MTDKKFKEQKIGIGEINTIRQILVGERFEHFERQLNSLQNEVYELRQSIETSTLEMRDIIKKNGKNVRMEMLNKIVDLENRMVKNHDKTGQRIKKDKEDQKAKLSKLFIQLGKEFK